MIDLYNENINYEKENTCTCNVLQQSSLIRPLLPKAIFSRLKLLFVASPTGT
jgi:hypothetical protein